MNALDSGQDLVGRQYEPHGTDEETGRSSNVPRITQLAHSRAGTQTQLMPPRSASQVWVS